MTPEIMTLIREAHEPSTQPYFFQRGNICVSSQRPDGKSKWAKWVRWGYLAHNAVVWVFKKEKGGRTWMFLSLDTGRDKGLVVDVRHYQGKQDLKALEARMEKLIRKEMEEDEKIAASASNLAVPYIPFPEEDSFRAEEKR